MANLLLYSGITPNANNTHYLYDNIATFKTTLQSYLFKTVTLDNYRINTGIIKVKIDETLTTSNYKNVTYAINENDNMCYIVKSGILQSGYVVYDCDVDYWGTYIAQASLSHINVIRCNRNIDIGIYDDIKATINNTRTRFDIPFGEYVIDTSTTPATEYKYDLKYEKVWIAFQLTFNVKQNVWGGTATTGMYAMRLDDIATRYRTDNPNAPLYTNVIDIARSWVGGIYSVKGTNIFGVAVDLDAKVTKAYIVPQDLLLQILTPYNAVNIATYSPYGDYDINNPLTCYELPRATSIKSFSINIDPNYNYYVGTINNGLKLIRDTSGTTTVEYQSIVTPYNINIIVKQGDNQKDITNEFEIGLTFNDGDVTNLSAIKNALKLGISVAEGTGTGNYAGVIKNIADNTISMIGNHYYGKQQGNGDAVINFCGISTNIDIGVGVIYPYGYITSQSTTDEQVNARNKGAYFDCYVDTITSIFNYSFIGTGTNNDATFVQAKLCIDNIPSQAITEISTRFNKGVYLVKL